MRSHYHYMFAVLVGDKGAYELFHERQAWTALGRLFQKQVDPETSVISIAAQDRAAKFLRSYGTRVARKFVRSLER